MAASVLYMSMSLDGFIAGPNETDDNGLGDGGARLHEWEFTGQVLDEFLATGAVLAGRGTAAPADYWAGDHHNGVPIFIIGRDERDERSWPLVTDCPDIVTAMAAANDAAGARNVLVHGAGIAQLALTAGLLDEMEIHLIPVLLSQGRRLFDGLPPDHIELERTRVLEGNDGVTHLHYRIRLSDLAS